MNDELVGARVKGVCECHGVLVVGVIVRRYDSPDLLSGTSMDCYAVRVTGVGGVEQRMLCDIAASQIEKMPYADTNDE